MDRRLYPAPPFHNHPFPNVGVGGKRGDQRSSSWVLWEGAGVGAVDGRGRGESPASPWCSILTILVLFLVILGVLAVAGLALYLGALRLEPVQSLLVFDGKMRVIGDRYAHSLANRSSPHFADKAARYHTLLEAAYRTSLLGPSLEEIIVTSFANGSLLVFFRIILDRRKLPKSISSVEEATKSVILQEASSPLSVMNALQVDPKALYIRRYIETSKFALNEDNFKVDHRYEEEDTSTQGYKGVKVIEITTQPSKTRTRPGQTVRGTFTVTTSDTTRKRITEDAVTPSLVLPNKTAKTTTLEPPGALNTKHSPFLKQYLQRLSNQTGVTKIPLGAKGKTTTTAASITRTSTAPPETSGEVDEPWRPFMPSSNTMNKGGFPGNVDFDYGVGEAEVIGTEDSSSFPLTEAHGVETTTHPLIAPTLPDLSEQKSMPSLSILQQFHNLDSLLKSTYNKSQTGEQAVFEPEEEKAPVVTLLPVKSNVGVRAPVRPRPTVLPTDDPFPLSTPDGHEISFLKPLNIDSPETNADQPYKSLVSPEPELVSIPLQKYFTQHPTRPPRPKGNERFEILMSYVTENLKDIANIKTDGVEYSPSRSPRKRKEKRSLRLIARPLDQDMRLLLEEIFHNFTTTSRSVKLNQTHILDFNVTLPSPIKTLPLFDIDNTQMKLNKLAKLQIGTPNNATNRPVDKVSNKAMATGFPGNEGGFKLLTKVFNKTPPSGKPDDRNQSLHLDQSKECGKNTSFQCGSGECISAHLRCNKLVDCEDKSDEKNCSCLDYLRTQHPTRKICDGVVDCWDYSDESNCEWCTPGQHMCKNSRMCIETNQVCDGFAHCPYGDDEKNCIAIAPSAEVASGESYYPSGYLMIRKEGEWGKMCLQNFDHVIGAAESDWSLEDLGESVCRTMTYKEFIGITREKEGLAKTAPYFQLAFTTNNDSFQEIPSRGEFTFKKTACIEKEVVKVQCADLECGIRPEANIPWATERRSRIVGGGNAGPGAWPWQAALYKEGEFQCGGTLISDSWLLSAGHCFHHALNEYWVARLGALRRGAPPSPYEQLRPIAQIVLHPDYKDAGFLNDISLLRLSRPVHLTTFVRPICLPPPNTHLKDGALCTVVGWGQLFEVGRVFPDTLQEVQLPVISTNECRKRTLFLPLYRVTENMFCAGYDRGGRDACLGDSGGPLMCQEKDGRWVLTGVTSNGYGCARPNRPGVYTKVVNYLDWVQDHLVGAKGEQVRAQGGPPPCNGHRCPLGECLPPARLCNGFTECRDSSDEADCW